MKVVSRGRDFFGYSWSILLWGQRGLHIELNTSCIDFGAGLGFSWEKDLQYIELQLFNIGLVFFFKTEW